MEEGEETDVFLVGVVGETGAVNEYFDLFDHFCDFDGEDDGEFLVVLLSFLFGSREGVHFCGFGVGVEVILVG